MATLTDVVRRTRGHLGDTLTPFRSVLRGDGEQKKFSLPNRNVSSADLSVFRINPDDTEVDLMLNTDFTLDATNGIVTFTNAPVEDSKTIVQGSSYGFMPDDELTDYINDAVAMHFKDRQHVVRYRESHGFIQYDRVPMTLDNMPDEEVNLVAMLAAIQALWALSTDAASDIDVQTSEGTSIPRGQRHRQLLTQIAELTAWYKELSLMLGVGVFAPETFDLRRVSRTTGRLVPIFVDREYDEYGPPVRKTIQMPSRDQDPDGPVSPWWPGPAGY